MEFVSKLHGGIGAIELIEEGQSSVEKAGCISRGKHVIYRGTSRIQHEGMLCFIQMRGRCPWRTIIGRNNDASGLVYV